MPADIPVAAPARKRGRPTKLTPETRTTIITAVQDGTSSKAAAATARVTPRTVQSWAARGRQPDAPDELRAFREDYERACAERRRKSLTYAPIIDDQGREIGTRRTRRLPNGTLEVTEYYQRPTRRTLRDMRRNLRSASPELSAALRLDGAA